MNNRAAHSILVLGCALQKGDSGEALLAGLQAIGPVRVVPETPRETGALRELLRGREILVLDPIPYVFISREALGGSSLRFVTVTTSGFDHLDVKAAHACEISVSNVPAYGSEAVAEHTLGLLLALFRKIPAADRIVRSGGWDFRPFLGREIAGKTFGIIGLGEIGTRVAQLAQAFGARVLACDIRPRQMPDVERAPLRRLLEESDIVSLHADLNPTSMGLIGPDQLSWMKPSAVLVNTARGHLVVEKALVDALKGGKIAGAALDVLTAEKPGTDNPLFGLPNVLFSPHVAFCTQEALVRRNQVVLENVRAYLKGSPVHQVGEELVACP
jgi:phosphoglycerate dehydrogenase-like enzyme